MDQLAELRERRALTLRELSEMSGVAADTINQIELGHRKPRPSTLRKLARALEVDVEELMLPKGSAPSTPGQPKRRRPVFDVVREAALKQAEQDRKAFNRAIASEEIPQAYWKRHENEVMPLLREYDPGEVAEAYFDLMTAYVRLEHEHTQLAGRVEALERQLEEVST